VARTDAQRLLKLLELRDAAEDRLHEVLSKPKPSYKVDGQQFGWTEYAAMLKDQIQELDEIIASLDRPTGLTMTQVFTGP
jgi:tRNA A37 N6-isopentenylltransferase MiaA